MRKLLVISIAILFCLFTYFSSEEVTHAAQKCGQGDWGKRGKQCCDKLWGAAGGSGLLGCVEKDDTPIMHDRYGEPLGVFSSSLPGAPSDICLCLPEDKQLRQAYYKCGVDDLECLSCIENEGLPTVFGCLPAEPGGVVRGLFRIGIALGAAYALLCIIFGSIKIQASRGSQDKISSANQQITSCIIGLIILLFTAFMLNLLGGSGIFGFTFDPLTTTLPSVTPPPTPVPTSTPAPSGPGSPSPIPAPPPPGTPGTGAVIRLKEVQNALAFFEALKDVRINGARACTAIHKDNYEECLAGVSTGVPNEDRAKSLIKSEIDAMKDTKGRPDLDFLQCGSFQKALFAIMTGETMTTAYKPGTKNCVKNLAEPFWKFTYYDKDDTSPVIGDLVKWSNAPCGHVGLIVSVQSPTDFDVIHANLDTSRTSTCQGCLSRSSVDKGEDNLEGFYRIE